MPSLRWPLRAVSSHKDSSSDLVNVLLGISNKSGSVLANKLVGGDFCSIIEDKHGLLASTKQKEPTSADELADAVTAYSYDDDERSVNAYFFNAIAYLGAFVQVNFTGPFIDLDIVSLPELRDSCLEYLSSDGQSAFKLCYYPGLLVGALAAMEQIIAKSTPGTVLNLVARWWYSRALVIRQSLLLGTSAHIYNKFIEIYPSAADLDAVASEKNWDADQINELRIRHQLEKARFELIYDQDTMAKRSILRAKDLSKMKSVLTGSRAKRTKFQQRETVQMVYLAKSFEKVKNKPSQFSNVPGPAEIELNSDLLLERLVFSDAQDGEQENGNDIDPELQELDPNNQPVLNDIDSAIILLEESLIKKTSPHNNNLVNEELTAMANRLIEAPTGSVNWSLFSRALWERSLLEADSSRTVERGTLQIQSLAEEMGQGAITSYITTEGVKNGSVEDRMKYIYQLDPLPRWSLDLTLAEKFMALGLVKSATEIYERLELWSDVALCYAAVGQESKGKEIIKEYLESNPNDARAWSIFGDITENVEYWEKAWQVGKYASAKRALGRYYYYPPKNSGVERDLVAALTHFQDSLTVNPLNSSAWFTYGCIGLETENWEIAAEAFTRCVSLDEYDAKSWSNLASALLQLHKKQEAFTALQRAVRADPDIRNWRIWENLVKVAIDLGDWQQAVVGATKLVDLRGKKEGEASLDPFILESLAQALVESDVSDLKNEFLLFPKTCVDLLVNKVPGLITTNARLWKIVARVHVWLKHPWDALEDYEKAFRIYSNNPQLEENEAVWNGAVDACQDLVDAYTNFGPQQGRMGEGSFVSKDWKFKSRSAVRSLSGKGKLYWEDSKGWEKLQAIKNNL